MLTSFGISGGPHRPRKEERMTQVSGHSAAREWHSNALSHFSLAAHTVRGKHILAACVFFSLKTELWIEGTWDLLKIQDTSLECSNLQQARVIGNWRMQRQSKCNRYQKLKLHSFPLFSRLCSTPST